MQIDWWTLALQAVNVLILILILGRFFFRPVAAIVAKRQQEVEATLADAAAERRKAAALSAEVEQARSSLAAERQHSLDQARGVAQAERDAIVAQSADSIAKLRGDASAQIARDRAEASAAVVEQASDLSIDIATRLLRRLPADLAFQAFLDGLEQELQKRAGEFGGGAAGVEADRPTEIITATRLSEEQQDRVRQMLRATLGRDPSATFKVDETLLAGLELHAHGAIVRNNWRADLQKIREVLAYERNHGRP